MPEPVCKIDSKMGYSSSIWFVGATISGGQQCGGVGWWRHARGSQPDAVPGPSGQRVLKIFPHGSIYIAQSFKGR